MGNGTEGVLRLILLERFEYVQRLISVSHGVPIGFLRSRSWVGLTQQIVQL